jgi:predicted O-methyltransferase YrrM
MTASEAVLIFPAGLPDALDYQSRAQALGQRVVGASSLAFDQAKNNYADWATLPFVHEDGFDDALAETVRRHDIGAIYTSHFVIWKYLSERLEEIAPDTRLIGGQTLLDGEAAYRKLRQRLADDPLAAAPFYASAVPARPALSEAERIGLVRLVGTISGMCSEEKVLALIDALRHAPEGDIVEIGSWWGKSAAAFAWLANRYQLGAVLCVDPWEKEAQRQGTAIVDTASDALDTDEAVRIFEINLAPLAFGRLNYVRDKSANVGRRFGPGFEAETGAFGRTSYTGQIAVLHIDGNHAYEHVAEDAEVWIPHMKPGGFIIFDDYVWPFGDGPKRVGDRYVEDNAERIAFTFVSGTALFVQLKA